MSTEQENFDDLLKSKLNENEFTFNEANWDKAEIRIIEAEKKRKRRRIGFIFFIGVVLGVCVMIPFIGDKNNIEKKDLSSKKKNIEIENKTESKLEYKTEKGNEIAETGVNKVAFKGTKQDASVSNSNNVIRKDANKEVSLNKETATNLNSKLIQKNSTAEVFSTETKISKTTKAQTQKGRRKRAKYNKDESLNKDGEITEDTKVNSTKVDKPNKVKENTILTKNENPTVAIKNPDSKIDSAQAVNNLKKDTSNIRKDSIVKAKVDSVKPLAKNEIKIFEKLTIFSIDAGANYAFGWANNITKEAAGFNAVFGISVTHQFAEKWSVLVGIQYSSLAHLNYSNYTSNNMQYDFGYSQAKTVITPTILYYMAVPIKLQYHFNDKNSLSIGINALYLLNTNSKVETYTQSTFGAFTTNTSTKTGYTDGFSTWDIQPALAYRRRIVKFLSLSAEVYYGVVDIKNNAVFGFAKSEHNSGLKLTLSYNLFCK